MPLSIFTDSPRTCCRWKKFSRRWIGSVINEALQKIYTKTFFFSFTLEDTLLLTFRLQFLVGCFSESQSRAQSYSIIHKSIQVFFFFHFYFQWVISQLVAKLSSLQVQVPVPRLDIGRRIKGNWGFCGSWLWKFFSAYFWLGWCPVPFSIFFLNAVL